jgi:hypothetical protein
MHESAVSDVQVRYLNRAAIHRQYITTKINKARLNVYLMKQPDYYWQHCKPDIQRIT